MDSSTVDAAVVGALQADATLKGLCPDGVYFDEAPQAAQRFVIVKLDDHQDTYIFSGQKGFELSLYLVKAVIFSTSGGDAKKAATAIDAVLHNSRALVPAGYQVINVQRAGRIRYAEPDVNPDQRWQHQGAHYALVAVPTTEGR